MQKIEKLLYDLPCVLFEDYLKFLGVSKINVEEILYHKNPIKLRYAELPGKTEFETTYLILMDRRFQDAKSVQLFILSNMGKGDLATSIHQNVKGVIEAGATSYSTEIEMYGEMGFQYWLSTKFQPGEKGVIPFSFKYSVNTIVHIGELIKRAQALYVSNEYGWINSYFGNKKLYKPLGIQGLEVERPFIKY